MIQFGAVTHPGSLNYGDDIQSIAAMRLLPKVDHYLDRENLHQNIQGVDGKIKTICNGWFMEHPEHWPPGEQIDPLFISMHITHNHNARKLMLDQKHLKYYKKHEPIGCRDRHTSTLFQKAGIEAYYSGCVTLTLQNLTKDSEKTEEILFVDAFNKNLPYDLRKKMLDKLLPPSLMDHVTFIEHSHPGEHKDLQARMKISEALLDRYSKAHLVVTSRIHVALPCVALGVPVLFMDVAFNLANSRNRFDGVIDYFNCMDNRKFAFTGIDPVSLVIRRLHLYNYFYPKGKLDFDWHSPPENPVDIEPIANKIREKVDLFLKH